MDQQTAQPPPTESAPRGVLVVTGTGTGIGKTVVTAAIAALAHARGDRVAIVKPAQTGVHPGPGSDVPDAETIERLSGVADTHELARFPDPLSPEACRRTIPVFDGRMRFDLQMSFKRMDVAKAEKGYRGPAVVCAIQFVPLAGYVPDRPAVKYLVSQHDIEVWLAPVMGTRVVVPFRVSIPTPLGRGVLEATQFITTPAPPRLTANSPTH